MSSSSSINSKRSDVAWKHCTPVRENDKNEILCSYCRKVMKGGITRVKQHLIGKAGNVTTCLMAPEADKVEIRAAMGGKKLRQNEAFKKAMQEIEVQCEEGFLEYGGSDSRLPPIGDFRLKDTRKGQSTSIYSCKKLERQDGASGHKRALFVIKKVVERVYQYIARFWYQAGISFNLIKLESFQDMIREIGHFGKHLKAPSYHDIRVPLLQKEVEFTNELMKPLKDQWASFGCSLMSDAWTDRKQRSIINFLVNSSSGTMFLRSVDASDYVKTGEKIFELLDSIVEEIGEEKVVQVITDNGSNYVLAGRLLEEKRKKIYWTPCAAHCIDLMLEDIGKLPHIKKTIQRAISLVGFIYSHSSTLSMLRFFSEGRELVRHAITRKKKPTMGYIYEAMDKAKETIMKSFKNESKYKDVFEIIDKRWDIQLHRPLHAAGHFLNPEFFYANPQMEFNGEIIRGLYDCINKLLGDLEMEKIVHKELAHYKAASGMFGCTTAIAMRGEVAPAQWWRMYGSDTPYLQQLAIRILSLTCSASGCERNWSVFEQVHTKRRNRLEHKRLHDLVFVKYNQALHQRYNLKDEIDPISLNGIDDCNEWLIGEMDEEEGEDERVHEGDDDLTWRQVYQASGLDEPRQYTRHHKRRGASRNIY
uniref:BED-type domain-containing protein n=2 Tax=Cajanus cajan TaxID=3821 RepID=A0A151S1Q6_CAJCA|nr:hypothetical protein KK1_029567 [Cajanus cajan]